MSLKKVDGRYSDIANRLRLVRSFYDLSSKRFAEQAGVSVKSYSQWESGDFRISLDGALSISARFGISLDYIYLGRLDTLPYALAISLKDTESETKKAPIQVE